MSDGMLRGNVFNENTIKNTRDNCWDGSNWRGTNLWNLVLSQ